MATTRSDLYDLRMLQRVRHQKGMTQAQIARRAGISELTYRNAELGYHRTTKEVAKAIAKALRVPLKALGKKVA